MLKIKKCWWLLFIILLFFPIMFVSCSENVNIAKPECVVVSNAVEGVAEVDVPKDDFIFDLEIGEYTIPRLYQGEEFVFYVTKYEEFKVNINIADILAISTYNGPANQKIINTIQFDFNRYNDIVGNEVYINAVHYKNKGAKKYFNYTSTTKLIFNINLVEVPEQYDYRVTDLTWEYATSTVNHGEVRKIIKLHCSIFVVMQYKDITTNEIDNTKNFLCHSTIDKFEPYIDRGVYGYGDGTYQEIMFVNTDMFKNNSSFVFTIRTTFNIIKKPQKGIVNLPQPKYQDINIEFGW